MKKEFKLSEKKNKILSLFDASKLLRDMQTGRMIRLRTIVQEVLGHVEEQDKEFIKICIALSRKIKGAEGDWINVDVLKARAGEELTG